MKSLYIFFCFVCINVHADPLRSGIVIYREQQFYSNNLVDVFVYDNYLDKGASSSALYGGYYIFIGQHGSKVHVPANTIIANLTNEEINPDEISTGNSYNSYFTTYSRVLDLMRINQKVSTVLSPLAEHMKINLDRISAGNSFRNGEWICNNKSNDAITKSSFSSGNQSINSVLEDIINRSKHILGVQ